MTKQNPICTLDFLAGTLATAYKGMVTSLVMKDFCEAEENGTRTFTGRILSMPGDDYAIVLLQRGTELDRAGIKDGEFELRAPAEAVGEEGNLQLDVLRGARHVGTFLLRKEQRGGPYTSALELSRELRDMDFKMLTDMVQGRRGLERAAEALVASFLSSKRDWRKLSGDIRTFASDLFWYQRGAFYMWFPVLARFSARAAAEEARGFGDKTVMNVLDLVELPLEKEAKEERKLAHALSAWAREVEDAGVVLSYRYGQAIRVLSLMRGRGVEVRGLLRGMLQSLEGADPPAVRDGVVLSLAAYTSPAVGEGLRAFSQSRKAGLREGVEKALRALSGEGGPGEALSIMQGLDVRLLDEKHALGTLFDAVESAVGRAPGEVLTGAVQEAFGLMGKVAPEAREESMSHAAGLLRKAAQAGERGLALGVLGILDAAGPPLSDILLGQDIAGAVLGAKDRELLDAYRGALARIRVPPPRLSGFSSETWAEKANPRHLRRLRGFLRVLAVSPGAFREAALHLAANLVLSGVFIPDDALFQREVSHYLNAGALREDFLPGYLILKRLPVYFHDVGASGKVRELSTELDAWGNDPALYFLRKQVHANASNNNVPLVESVIRAWYEGDAGPLEGRVPEEVLEALRPGLLEAYQGTARTVLEELGAVDGEGLHPERLLGVGKERVEEALEGASPSDEVRRKMGYLFELYREIVRKYAFLGGARGGGSLGEALRSALERAASLAGVLTSPERTEPEESLYFKRHIAFGIPSVIGTYHEAKFDAMGELLREEERVRVLLEELIDRVESAGDGFGREKTREWLSALREMAGLFELHGLGNARVRELVGLLGVRGLRLSQLVDLLRMWQGELTWLMETLYRDFQGPVLRLLGETPVDELPEHLLRLRPGEEGFRDRALDVLIRQIINGIAGFEELDRLLNALIRALGMRVAKGEDEEAPDGEEAPERAFYVLDELGPADASLLGARLGSKANNLVYLLRSGLDVPPAVALPSLGAGDYAARVRSAECEKTLREAVQALEGKSGAVFGSGENPLFLSVRSGSYVSMPGILDSVLYVGMNEATRAALERRSGDPWLARDSERRFLEHYGSIVLGLGTEEFDRVKEGVLARRGASSTRELGAPEMAELTRRYREMMRAAGKDVPDDVYLQLRGAAEGVYASWHRQRARDFRAATGVSEHWGTGVLLMQMVYGNQKEAGASVFFTRNPRTLGREVYGETMEQATGDELVYGRSAGRPIARWQGEGSLEETDRELFELHARAARRVEEAMGGIPEEVEAAYRRREGRLYVLQTKRMEFRSRETDRFHEVCRMESNIVGRGIGVYGGALSGAATFARTVEELRGLREKAERPLILIRKETSTRDVALLAEVQGILTAVGGAASHAAILSQKFGITAVVGCTGMLLGKDPATGEPLARVGGYEIREGTPLSIDGSDGLVYTGVCEFIVRKE
ncbi:MAG: PEP-utilizing enzyme [Nitrospirota bacterium]